MADPFFLNTPLILPFDGANNSTTIENAGAKGISISVNGGAKLSTEQSKFGGSSLKVNGSPDYLTFPDVILGSGDWTIECWVYLRSAPVSYAALMVSNGEAGLYLYDTTLIFYPNNTGNTGTLSLNTWHHVAAVRSADKLYLYINGVAGANAPTVSGAFKMNTIGSARGVQGSQSYIDDVRFTAGVARYTGNFTPPGAADTTRSDIYSRTANLARRVYAATTQSAALKPLPVGTTRNRESDLLFGGRGRISGVTKVKGTPDAAVSTRVRLIREKDGLLVRETWSDPVTGAFTFANIAHGIKYTVLTYDHNHNERAVVADNLTPELMP
ncbi:LamG domain-containing protein [Undibacterium sp.]|uniref:LamG domain-containing protein n=1 Tax=Undibacterium sp. TaxID=1914977 RepID=UPI0027301FC7|nr:LamG domain-containing protein [Undibacterium sp.]MDP1980468.1 LamG domain-containing protein [Undibacterium sp.]